MRFFQLFTLLLLFYPIVLAQNPNRQYVSWSEEDQGVVVQVSDGRYLFRAYSPQNVEVNFIPIGEAFLSQSHAVAITPLVKPFLIGDAAGTLSLVTENGIEIRIQKSPFKVSFWFQDKEITSENLGYQKGNEGDKLILNLRSDEVLYGGGARALGMNRRGNRLELYNRAHYGYEEQAPLMNYCMPLVISNRCYAVHFDNASTGFLDLDSQKNNQLTFESSFGRKTYQVIVGENWKQLVQNYTELTGRQPMPALWTFGNFASRFGYHSENEARNVVNRFRAEKIPLDAIIFDLYWFGKTIQGTLGNLDFYTDSFPTPQKMISDFNSNKVKTILITEPFILTTSSKWKEAVEKKLLATDKNGEPFKYDFYFGNTGLLDIYQTQTKTWFWEVYKKFASMGVSGFWGDLGEPEVHPKDLMHGNLRANEVHNIYGHDWARLLSDGYKKDFPEQRPFILMRSGYSGTQRFGIVPWSGDVNRSWGGMRPQMEISLQMGLQGVGYMHSDLGGFAGANDDPELYVRWLQYGVFQPVFRPHAQEEVASEPIFKDEKTKSLAKKAIELRYRLLPYNYTLAFENHLDGTPLMRPVFMENPGATWSHEVANCYYWGSDFFVQPILKKAAEIQDRKLTVRLPENQVWIDFHTGKKYRPHENNQSNLIEYFAAEDHIPVFVKAGAFIPMSPVIQSTEDFDKNKCEVHFYYDESIKHSSGQWYSDDGKTQNAFENQEYSLIKFENHHLGHYSLITFKEVGSGEGETMETRKFTFIAHGLTRKPKAIYLHGKRQKFSYNKTSRSVSFTVQLKKQGDHKGNDLELHW
ncbi:MAG: hypothetical protein RL264_2629 [Bacteroidota bacterium]|jgi:alpha-glucosidase (family GH31 glycosyl hydrolase)